MHISKQFLKYFFIFPGKKENGSQSFFIHFNFIHISILYPLPIIYTTGDTLNACDNTDDKFKY